MPGNRKAALALVAIAGFLAGGDLALASDDIFVRVADAAKVGANNVVPGCPGRLFETFAASTEASGWTYGLRLVCATSPTTAAWVLIANSKCFDASAALCSSPKAVAIPPFNSRPNFRDDAHAPYLMQYQLLKYGLGRNCEIVKQGFTSATLAPTVANLRQEAWQCGQLDFFDGARDANGAIDDPRNFRAIPVATSASEPLAARKPEVEFPETFLTPAFWDSFEFQ
jgi:hypothetical protein